MAVRRNPSLLLCWTPLLVKVRRGSPWAVRAAAQPGLKPLPLQRGQHREARLDHVAQRHRLRQQCHQPVGDRHSASDGRRPALQQSQAAPAGGHAEPGCGRQPDTRGRHGAADPQGPPATPLSCGSPDGCPGPRGAAHRCGPPHWRGHPAPQVSRCRLPCSFLEFSVKTTGNLHMGPRCQLPGAETRASSGATAM